jgi:hypothetical protein
VGVFDAQACRVPARGEISGGRAADGTFRVRVRDLLDVLTPVPDTGDTSYVTTAKDREERCRCCILVNTKPITGADAEIDFVDIFISDADRTVVDRRLADFLSMWRPEGAKEYREDVMPPSSTRTSETLSYTIHGRTYIASRDFTFVDHEWTGRLELFSYDNPTAQE